jgi:biopolymer transport protein ExbD
MHKIRRPQIETEIPSVSMADIAFLLLIFFISTTVLGVEEGLTLFLPPKGTTTKLVSRANVLILRTDAEGRVFADDQPVVAVDRLDEMVRARLEANPELVVAIESHPQSKYKTMIQVLDEVKEARATRISIRALPAGEGPSPAGGGRAGSP